MEARIAPYISYIMDLLDEAGFCCTAQRGRGSYHHSHSWSGRISSIPMDA